MYLKGTSFEFEELALAFDKFPPLYPSTKWTSGAYNLILNVHFQENVFVYGVGRLWNWICLSELCMRYLAKLADFFRIKIFLFQSKSVD